MAHNQSLETLILHHNADEWEKGSRWPNMEQAGWHKKKKQNPSACFLISNSVQIPVSTGIHEMLIMYPNVKSISQTPPFRAGQLAGLLI